MMMQEAKFQSIADWIKKNIEDGVWKAGDRLPTENALAEQFGVSRQTVRRALDVLKAEKVIEKTQGSGTFVYGQSGRKNTQRQRNYTIAIISTYVDHYIFTSVLKGVEKILTSNGYMLQIFFTNDSIHHEKTILKNLIQRNDVDGIIVEPSKSALPNPNIPLYQELQNMGIPMINFHTGYPELQLPCVCLDDKKVAYDATELLIQAGHESIAGIFNAEDGQGRLRYSGFLKAMWDNHLRTDSKRTIWLDSDMLTRLKSIEEYLFDCMNEVTAVLCYNDEIAYEIINMAVKRGIRVPEDLSVVSIDDSDLASINSIPFTSFRHPKEALGRILGENMLRVIEDPDSDANYVFDSEPSIRQSIVPPVKKGFEFGGNI
ncbi:MAG: GntR family transcriptional regulator [Lachnospiraceae bacterium]|nr:GntR family transcriptional regulator [Lachnospiraceae bacterium]